MADFQIQPNKINTLFYITYRTKRPNSKRYKKNYLHNKDGTIVSFTSKAAAQKYQKSLRAKEDAKNSLKVLREQMAQKYGDHFEFLTAYLKQRKRDFPKNWERSEWNMLHYVFPYFLYELKKGNTEEWCNYFDDFTDKLEDVTTIRKNRGKSKLSISSRNKIIDDLNGYMTFLFKKRYLLTVTPKCDYITGAEDSYRNGDDIVENAEYQLVLQKFDEMIGVKEFEKTQNGIKVKKIRSLNLQIQRLIESKLLYIICRHTGMRVSEALGPGFGDYFPSAVKDDNLNKIIAKNELTTLGYIILKSQLGAYDRQNQKWKREPLKTKKKISLDNARTIPIFSDQSECDAIL